MTGTVRTSRRACLLIAVACVALAASSCAWKPYVVTRAVRHVTGARTRFHPIVPLTSSLKTYRVIEMTRLENTLPGHVPPRMEEYLNQQIMKELEGLASSPHVLSTADDSTGGQTAAATDGDGPTLLVDGYLDDYDPGSLPLRVVELGFNHVAVTVRIRLRDKASGRIIAAASVTAEDNRATGTTRAAIDHLAKRIRTFVSSGYEG